jgi:surface antigen
MKKILLALTLSLALAAPTAASAQSRNKELFGTLGGAALGGFLGSQVGSGKGKLAATGAGVLLGGLLGNQVGRSLDRADQTAISRSQHQALEYTPSNQAVAWQNPDTGNRGVTVPRAPYQTSTGQYCREFQQTVTVGNQTQQAYGTACRQPDGTWRIVQ